MILIAILLAPSVGATSSPLQEFAACAGRYSAAMERQWLLDLPGAQRSERRRAVFVELVDAILPDSDTRGAVVLTWRINAKLAQAALFTRADFGPDIAARPKAAAMAESYLQRCDGLILAS